jgi:NAD(P)-dependent dehydrogenase (short-subunit alcohol dehydrogenase family)
VTQSALVTGGGSGIGAAVVLAAARGGTSVAALDVDGARAAAVADEARRAGAPAALGLAVDVRDEAALAQAVEQVRDELGVPTRVLANAGIEVNGAAHEQPLEEWERTIAVNLTGAFLTARLAIRAMLDANATGSVVFTSSPAALVGFAGGGNAAYAASKGGISSMVRTLALDYAPHGIRVNAVLPGSTDTPMLTAALPESERAAAREEFVERARHEIPLGRLAAPAEIAAAVLWLWSDAASYVTASQLAVDGGLLAKSANTF